MRVSYYGAFWASKHGSIVGRTAKRRTNGPEIDQIGRRIVSSMVLILILLDGFWLVS
jgi:hypothetical protein